MKLPSSTMGFARVSFPLIQAGGMWQCRYSCILWAPKLRPPIWIQAFQIVKWHSSFSVSPDFSSVLEVPYSPHISFFFFFLTPFFLHPFTRPLFLLFGSLLSCSPSDFRPCSCDEGLQWPPPLLPPCPRALIPTPCFPWVILRRGNTIRGCEIKYITPFQIKVFLRQLLIHVTL